MSRRIGFVSFCGACLAVAPLAVGAGFTEDFTGGLNHPWVVLANDGSSPPSATSVDSSMGDLQLLGEASMFPDNFNEFAVALAGLGQPTSSDYFFADEVTIAADVRALPNIDLTGFPSPGNNDIFVAVRSDGPNGYVLALDFDSGEFDLVRSDGGDTTQLGDTSSETISVDADATYRLELSASGDMFVGNIYESGGTTPLATVSGQDSTYASGVVGVGSAINDNGSLGGDGSFRTLIGSAFDNIVATDGGSEFLPGDFDKNGAVDGIDFLAWQSNFPTASGATQAQGDADGNGTVDGNDFLAWQSNFGSGGGAGSAAVPEPTAGMLLLLGLISVAARRR